MLPTSARGDELADAFRQPPAEARPWVFWYWMRGAVSPEGITADLTAMKDAGIGGAYIFTIKAPNTPPEFTPVANPLTPTWWAVFKHTAREADRLGLKLGLDVGDGFATAGGPWITPELSMQKVVWSETNIEGAREFSGVLPQPPTNEHYYRELAVFAFPTPSGEGISSANVPVTVTSSVPGAAVQFLATGGDGKQQFQSDSPCWIQYTFEQPFTLRSLTIRNWPLNFNGLYHATRLRLEVSDDGTSFRPAGRLQPSRQGWQDWDADYTFSFAPITARCFRLVHDPSDAESGSEDLDSAKWKPRLTLRGLVLSSAPRIPGFEGKSGTVWRRGAPATAVELPSTDCISPGQLVNLTSRIDASGRLTWTPPAGRWTILRIGYTSTGHRNETGGTAKGLECDKFNPAAARLQFDRWFGEALQQLGPDLAHRVLKIFHVDSWEAGSQNWSPVFRDQFEQRRGYDPTPFLPTFAGFGVGDAATSERFLHDVRQTIADLLTENFFGTLAKVVHEHGCEFSAESTAPTMLGDGMEHFSQADIPMGEFWLRSASHDKPNDIADAVSGAHVYGRRIAQAEAYTELQLRWDEHPAMLKALGDHEFATGINRLVLHVFVHNPWLDRRPGMTLSNIGVFFQRDQTWWPDARGWTDYLSRCQALLQAGQPVADVAYFTGEELPVRALLPDRQHPALPTGYTADSINRDALIRLAKFEHGRLVLPGGSTYAALVLPTDPAKRSDVVAAKLKEFAPVLVGPGDSLGSKLADANVAPDLLATETDGRHADQLEWIHRATADADIYFVTNQRDAAREVRLSIRDRAAVTPDRSTARVPQLWDPVTGEISTGTGVVRHHGRTELPLRVEPNGSMFVVLRPIAVETAQSEQPDGAMPRDAAAVTLTGPWSVTFKPELGGPREPATFPALADWSNSENPGIRFYSGPATYRQRLTWTGKPGERVWLDLGEIANLAHVSLNGIDCGVAWTRPYRVEITHALRTGDNDLEIRVTNTWANRLQGDRTSTTPITWTTATPVKEKPLLPAGLLGPVRLLRR